MSAIVRVLSLCFAAGSFGALVSSGAMWAAGRYDIAAAAGIGLPAVLDAAWLYPRLVWGGLWGGLFASPWPRLAWWLRGVLFGLAPAAYALIIVFPEQLRFGRLAVASGGAAPLAVLAAGVVWGLAAAWLLQRTGSR